MTIIKETPFIFVMKGRYCSRLLTLCEDQRQLHLRNLLGNAVNITAT